jgi:signal transduction histidine kinase
VSLLVKVPLVLALVAIAIGIMTSIAVYRLLRDAQEREVRSVASAYLDGLAPALVDPTLRRDIWAVFEILDGNGPFSGSITPIETVVTDAVGSVIASSVPAKTRPGAGLPARFVDIDRRAATVVREASGRAYAGQMLFADGRGIGALHVEFDIAALLAERNTLLRTAVGWSAALALLLGLGGWTLLRRMMAPVDLLARNMGNADGEIVRPIPDALFARASDEFKRLFQSYNRMATALRERESLLGRLAAEERLASLGRLAAGVAHEINNPLGGLFATLHLLRHYPGSPAAREKAVDLLERGLGGIRDVVHAMLNIQRPERNARALAVHDFEDVRILTAPEIRARYLDLSWNIGALDGVGVPAAPVRQLSLNLVLNAIHAAPEHGAVGLNVRTDAGCLRIEVTDSGSGMDPQQRAFIEGRTSPRMSAAAPIEGLGLWLVRQIAAELRAAIAIDRSALGGSAVVVTIPLAAPGELTNAA